MTYKPKIKLWAPQLKAIKKANGKDAFAYLMAMRMGKTGTDLTEFGLLEDAKEVNDKIIIAPNGVYRTWETALKTYFSDDLFERSLIHVWETHGGVAHKNSLEEFLRTKDKRRPRILLMSVEALSVVDRARKLALTFSSQRNIMGTVDESVIIKNFRSKRTKFVVQRLSPLLDIRRILSGLVAPKSPLDLFSQFEYLDWHILGHRSYYSFRNRYAVMRKMDFGGRMVDIVVGYRNVEELQEKIEPYSFRVPFRPKVPSTYSIREVELTKEQKRIYQEIKDNATSMLRNKTYVSANLVITQMIRLHQVLCGHVKNEAGELVSIPEFRTRELLELLEDYEGKAIIWCSYDYNVRHVSEALEKHFNPDRKRGFGPTVARFWGGNTKTREAEEKIFFNNEKCRFMVATPDAGRFGRTWDNADLVVYFSSKADLDHRDQSEMRAMGKEKKRQVDFVDLVVPDTIDMKNLYALRNKINLSGTINGDNYREWIV